MKSSPALKRRLELADKDFKTIIITILHVFKKPEENRKCYTEIWKIRKRPKSNF